MQTECAIVGAGAAGLAMSEALVHRGVDHVVLEGDEIGNTWARQRWDTFLLNTPAWMNQTLGTVPPLSFSSRDEVVRLLTEQASRLPVRTHVRVRQLTGGGTGFLLDTSQGEVKAPSVVLASGLLNVPLTPDVPGRLASRVVQLHAADYRSPERLPEGAVLVVGGGQSGCQIAEDLVRSGRRVYLATARVGRFNWSYRGVETFRRLHQIGFWDQRPEDLEDPGLMRVAQPLVASGGRSLNLRMLSELGVTLLGRLRSLGGEQVTLDESLPSNVGFGNEFWARQRALMDAQIAASGESAAPPEPDPGEGPAPAAAPTTLDLADCDVSTVLWCAGFTGDLGWVRLPILDGGNRPIHRGTASAVPGLWFVGFPWLTRRRSGILFGFPLDAAETADAVVQHLGKRAPARG